MSTKNLTRKGLAVGAGIALVLSGLSVPAFAAGQADKTLVDLYPTTGTEYTVISGSGKTFALTSNEASSIAANGRNVKWLVEDADSAIEPKMDSSSLYKFTVADWSADGASEVVTIYDTGHTLKNGDIITAEGLELRVRSADNTSWGSATTASEITGEYTVANVVAGVSFTITDNSIANSVLLAGATTANNSRHSVAETGTITLKRSARAASGSYVVDSGVSNNNANELLTLVQGDETTTRTVNVTAWVDTNGDRIINDSEYTSPTRTITWKKATELAITTVLDPVVVGDTALTGYATTVPVLNGDQLSNLNTVTASFTRQGTTVAEVDSAASWSDTTKRFSFSQTLIPTVSLWETTKEVGIVSATVASNKITATTTAAHGLKADDYVTFTGVAGTDGTSAVTVSVHQVESVNANGVAFTTKTIATLTGVTLTNAFIGGSRAVAGAYTMTPTFAGFEGPIASNIVAAKTVTSVTNAVVRADGVNTSGAIRVGVKAATVNATLKDKDAKVVPNKQVRITVTAAPAGTHYINGTKITANGQVLTATSNASGVVAVAVTSDTAASGNTLAFKVSADGVESSATSLAWAHPDYEVYELNSGAVANVSRSVTKGGSLTLSFAVVDQWGAPLTGDYRLFATSSMRHVAAVALPLSNGRASVTVTDNQIVGAASAWIDTAVKVQRLVGSAWSDTTSLLGGEPTVRTYRTTVVDQTDVVLLDANAAAVYGPSAADLTDVVTDTAIKVVANGYLDNDSVFTDAGNAAVVVTGRVGNSLSYVGRPGAAVTITGSNDFLFVNGVRSAKGSLSFVADSSGQFAVNVYSQKAAKDSVVTVTSGGVSSTVKVTFEAGAADDVIIEAVKSVRAQSVANINIKVVDLWGNEGASTPGNVTISNSGPGYLTTEGLVTSMTAATGSKVNTKLILNREYGIATVTATHSALLNTGGTALTVSKAIWVGPIANAKAGAKKGRVIVEAYRAKGKTVNVFVGSTRVASFVADKANFSAVVRGVKSGTRNVSVRLSGPGEDFRGAITVK